VKQLQPHRLWLGHAGDAGNARPLFDAGVKAVVDLAVEEPPSRPPRELIACRFPLVDGAGNDPETLLLAIRTIATLIQGQVPTLVCCGVGVSRAPALTAAALSLVQRTAPAQCLERVAQQYPCDVNTALWEEVAALVATRPAT
jgi:protein-tyrosine phosphatase